jgi:Ser/Thr protein kinase RdoA (MazF antagonist)
MTADREAFERWNDRRRRIFYPKTDADFDLESFRLKKTQIADSDLSKIFEFLQITVSEVQLIPNAGTCHTLFRVKNHSSLILKISVEENDFGLAIEAGAMNWLRDLNLPSLEISGRAHGTLPGVPGPFLLMEEAKGKPLNQFEDAETQALPQPLLFGLGHLLGRIHGVEGEGAGFLDARSFGSKLLRGLHRNWEDYILLRLGAHLETCERIGAITNERNQIEKLFVEAAPLFHSAPMRWLHGDPGHHNVFSDGEKITAIIDWEDSLVGDPIFDVAYWGTFVRDEMREEFLRGYETVQKLPEDFERRYWLYYLRVAISKTVHRHLFGVKDRPGRPLASLRIQKALSKLAAL